MKQTQGFGDVLKSNRLSKGIDLRTVSTEIKVLHKYLLALEAENVGEFSNEVQLRGFLLKYCAYLGLEFDRVYALYRRDFGKKQSKTLDKAKKRRLIIPKPYILPLFGVLLLLIIGLISGANYISSSFALPRFNLSAPIQIDAPFNGFIVRDGSSVNFEGELLDAGVLRINGESIPTDQSNRFQTNNYPLSEGDNYFELTLTNSLNRIQKVILNVVRVVNTEPETVNEEEG